MATIFKTPSGKWRAQVRKNGIRKNKAFARKSDAQAWAVDIERAIEGGGTTGTIQPPKSMTLADVIDAYLRSVQLGKTARVNLTRVSDRIGTTPVTALDAIVLRRFVESRKADGVQGSTLSHDLSNLSSCLKWARVVKNLDINPNLAKEARQSLTAERIDTRSKERNRIPTDDELRRLCTFFAENDRQQIPMDVLVEFGASSAMRLSEICRIQIEDVNWNEQSVLIRERKDPQRKARNNQVVPLINGSMDLVRRAVGDRTEGRIFPFNPRSASASFSRACKKLGIVDLHFHDLRHGALTRLARLQMPVPHMAVVSGHKDYKHLQRYVQLGAEDVHDFLNKA